VFLFLISLAVTFVAAPGVRWLMLRSGVIDVPNNRSSHSAPTPRGGGIACLVGVSVAFGMAYAADLAAPWLAVVAALGLGVVGFADDRASLPPMPRLAAQVAAGALMGSAAGDGLLVVAGMVITPVVVNVVNFMDGINGITGLTAAVWGATAWLAGLAAGAETLWVLGAATAGAAVGFLPWNAPTARLFLGDVGSYLFGGLIAAGIIVGVANDASPFVLGAPLALYLADTGTVLARRASRGESLTEAHREHTYQRLTFRGRFSHLTVAILVASLAAIIAAAWGLTSPAMASALTLAVCLGYVILPATKFSRTNVVDRIGTQS
jgi:UDP-N-acetylmuramyl pentapeptide phosphotransferase/UDP-N-acetylglucosamine-1-phosphate transferase